MLVRIANREDPDQNDSSEAVRSWSALFVCAFLAGNKCSLTVAKLTNDFGKQLPSGQA